MSTVFLKIIHALFIYLYFKLKVSFLSYLKNYPFIPQKNVESFVRANELIPIENTDSV